MKSNFIRYSMISLCFLLISRFAYANYADINGISMYYESRGQGTPVVLLHGGYMDSDMWSIPSWFLSCQYQVIKIDSRGHGRSSDSNLDPDLSITYEQMANDTLALLDTLNITNAHFVGWSDGAVIASQIAAFHPGRVNKLVLMGASFEKNAYTDAFAFLMNNDALFNAFVDVSFGPKYARVNPNPTHWPVFRDKLHDLWQQPCYFAGYSVDYCLEPLISIKTNQIPTLVMVGDNEIIKQSHTQEIADAIGAELKIIPFAGHFLPVAKPFVTTSEILNFLKD